MAGRDGGKLKPLKSKKKKQEEIGDEEKAFKEKKKAEALAMKQMAESAKKGKPLVGGGIKKSGKKK